MAKKTRVQEEIEKYRQSQESKIDSWTAEKKGKQETAVQSAIRTARNSVDTDAWRAQWNQKQAVKKASAGTNMDTIVATPDNIWATGRTNAKSAQQRQEEAESRALVRKMQEESGITPATKQAEAKADEATKAPSALYGQDAEDWFKERVLGEKVEKKEEPEENTLSMSYWEDRVNSALENANAEKTASKTSGRIQKPDPERYDATQIQQYKEQEISDYKKVFDEQNALTENRYKAFQEAEAAVKEAEKAYAENTNGVTRKRYNEAYAAYEQAYSALKEASDRAGELADEVNALTAAYQKEYDDATRYAGKDYAGMQNYIWVVEQKLEQAQEGQKTAAGQDLKEFYEQEIDRAKKYSYNLASVDELKEEYDRLNALRAENNASTKNAAGTPSYVTDRANALQGSAASTTISDYSAQQDEADKIGSLMRSVQKAMNSREAEEARTAYEDYYNGTREKPDAKLADEQTVGAFKRIVAGETSISALEDEIERNIRYFPDTAKEVLLQLMEDGDYESAANYYKAYESEAETRFANKQYENVKDWASQNLGTAALATLASGVTGAVTPATAWVDNMLSAINNKIVDATGEGEYRFSNTNDMAYSGARITAALQEGTQAYNATTGEWEGALNLASGALSSAEQNVIQFALFGSASLPFMAASAAGQSTYQNLKSGATEEQAAVTGTVSGLIEYMTEKLPLEHLLDKIHTIQGGGVVTVGQIAKMVREQGLEEANEEVIGNIADNLFDMAYNGENSEYRQYSAQLQREGMSKAEADSEAFGKFFIWDSMEAAAAAYLSTFLLVGGNAVTAGVQAAQIGKEMKTGELYEGTDGKTQYTQKEVETLKLAQQIPDSYKGGRYAAEKLKDQVLEGKKLSNRLLGFAAITSNQAYADAARTVEQGLGMEQDTMSFKLAAAIAESYKEGAGIPSDALMDTLKNQIETDRVNKATAEHNSGKSAEETTTLSQYQTFLVKNGVGLKDAQNRTEVLNKLIQGQSVSDRELRSIRMSAKLTKQILQEVAGVEIPAGVTNEKDLMGYYRSAHERFRQKIKAEAEARTAQDAETVAARMAEQAEAVQKIMQEERTAAKSNVDERLQYFFEHGRTQSKAQQEATQAEAMQQATPDTTNAEQVTHGQQTAAESTASTKPGLVWDDYVQSSVDATTAEKIDTVAKALGVTVKFADEVAGGEANAQISGSEILIEKNNQNPLMFLLGHELTHRLQDLSPEQYQNFKAAIMDEIRGQAQAIADLYASHGKSITMEAALDEAAADYAGRMIDDGRVLDEFIEKHRDDRTLLQKIVDALRSLIQKLTGAERRKAETAEGKLLAALDAASEQAKRLQQETNDATMGTAESTTEAVPEYRAEDAVKAAEHTKGGVSASNLADVAKALGSNGMWSLFNSYDGNMDTAEYAQEFVKVYNSAREGRTVETTLDSNQKNQAEWAGTADAGRYQNGQTAQGAASGAATDETKYSAKASRGRSIELETMENNRFERLRQFGDNLPDIWYAYSGRYLYVYENLSRTDYRIIGKTSVENRSLNQAVIEEVQNNAIRTATDFSRRLKDLRAKSGRYYSGFDTSGNRETTMDDGRISGGDSKQLSQQSASVQKGGGAGEYVATKFSLKEDSQGRKLTEAQQEYFRDSKVRDQDGRLITVYHGTGAEFNEFAYSFVSMHGSMEGQGFYFTDNRDMAEGYQRNGGRLMEGYLNIQNPLSDSKITMTRAEVKKLLQTIDPTGDDVVINYDPRGGMGYPSRAWYNRSLAAAVDMIYDSSESDSEILAEIANSGAGVEMTVRTARNVLGYDGYIVPGKYDNATVYVAFESNQFKDASNKAPTSNPDIRYSLKGKTADGVEVYETSKEVRDMPYKQRMDTFMDIMRNEYVGRTAKFTANDGAVYYARFSDADLRKNLYGDKKSDRSGWNAKVKTGADGNVFELVENATHKGSGAETGKTIDAHKDVTGWEYFVKTVQIDGQVYDLLANVRKKPDGEYVYSVQLNKNKNKAPAPPVARAYTTANAADGYASERVPTNASGNSISNAAENVNPEISGNEQDGRTSAKGAEISREYADILEGRKELEQQVDSRRETLTDDTRSIVDTKAVEETAEELRKLYDSRMDKTELRRALQGLYDATAYGKLSGEEAAQRAGEIAGELIDNALEKEGSDFAVYKELREFLRDTRLNISEADRQGKIELKQFVRENAGRLKVGNGETNVGEVYSELSQRWPEFFDESLAATPAEQLQQIADVMKGIYAAKEKNLYSGYVEQAKAAVANDIMAAFFALPQAEATFESPEAAQQAEQSLERRNSQFDAFRSQQKAYVDKLMQKEQSAREKAVSKLKEQYKAKTETDRERRSARELRNKITRHAKTLSDRLLRPTDAKHVPEALRAPLAAVLEAINQEDAYTIKFGTEYRKALKHGGEGTLRGEHIFGEERELKGLLTDRTEAFRKLKEQYTKIASEGQITIDPELLGDAADGFQNSFDAVMAMSGTPIAEMTKGQLQTVWNVLRAVEHSVSEAGKVFSKAKYTQTQEWAEAMRKGTEHRKERYAPFNTTLLLDYENPLTFFSHYGEAGKAIYRMLRDAQDQQQLMVTEVAEKVQKIVDEKTVKALEHEAHTFTLKSGQSLTLTAAQIMDIYNLMQREQAKAHLTVGGIMQPEVKAGKTKVRRGTEAVQLTEADLKSIAGTLTPEQRKIADGLQKLTAGLLADFGNEASMKAYGYKKFTDAHYWPIRSASENVHSNVEKSGTQARSIKNIGMAKATTPGADNPLDISSVFDTFSDHAADMTDYAAWLCPMEDANHLFNYSVKGADGRVEWTVKSILDRYGGRGAQQYWKKLMEDIQNGIKTKDYSPVTNLASKAISGFKGAAVGGNIRVVIQQPTAFFRAAAVMNPLDMAKGLVKGATKGSGWKKALQYSPIAQRKDNGSFDISAPYSMHQTLFDGRSALAKTNDALSAPAGVADAVTWGKIWNGCEHTVARNYENLTPGSKAFYEQVAKQFAEVIDQTQVVDGVLQRSNIMRAKSEIARQATSFKGEPLMSLNLLIRNFQEARYAKDGKTRARATGRLARAGFALAVTAGINALAQSLIDAIRDDDPDKKYWQRFMSAFTGVEGDETSGWEKVWHIYSGNLADGLILVDDAPFISDIVSMIQGYEVARQDTEVINDIINAGESFIKSIDGTGQKTRAYAIKQLFGATAKLFAVPVNNLTRDVWGVARSFAVERDNLPLQYEMDKAIYNIDNDGNAGRFSDLMYKALRRGEDDTFEHIKTDLMEHMGKTEEEIKSALKSRVREDYINQKFTSEEAAAFLVEHGLEDDEFEAFWTIQKWDNRKNEGWTKTKELGDTVFNGGVSPTGMTMDEVVDFYVEHGMEKSDVQSAITGFIHDAFDAGEVDVEMAQDLLYQYQAYDEDEESYKDEDDVYWTVKEWVEQYNGNEDWRKYGELGDAVTAGKDIENLLKQYEAHGADAEDQITSELHEAWKDGKLSDKDAVRRLIQYEKAEEELDAEYTVYTWKVGGELSTVYKNGEIKKKDAIAALLKYEKADDQLEAEYKIYEWELGMELSRAYKKGKVTEKEATAALLKYEKAKNEHEAYWTIREWEGGEDWHKYDQFVSAVESGTNLSETISYYKDHGVTEKTLKSQITTHFKPLYVEASVHERQYMKEYLLDAFEALGKPRWKASNDIDDWLED